MIVFPMAGLSRRFSEAGYAEPKYMLPLGGRPCFDHAVAGFRVAYADEPFLFVVRDVHDTPRFVTQRLDVLGVAKRRIVVLPGPTSGQGETVEIGLRQAEVAADEVLTVFNIDTFRHDVRRPDWAGEADGFLEVFIGSGSNWSFVDPAPGENGRVTRTTEKVPVSDLCCTGLYGFRRTADFLWALDRERAEPTSMLRETYIAPIYNHLIAAGRDIRYGIVPREDVVFCGVPVEYEALRDGEGMHASPTARPL